MYKSLSIIENLDVIFHSYSQLTSNKGTKES